MPEQIVLVIGEVFIDTHLDIIDSSGPLVRLGGIFHSARAFNVLNIDYALAYYAPSYLDDDINYWALYLSTKGCYKIGNINRAPNVMLVNESKEVGDQGYYNILKDQAEYSNTDDIRNIIHIVNPTDILLYPGRYDTVGLLNTLHDFKGRIHIDFHYDSENILKSFKQEIETIILSTSSDFFKTVCRGSFEELIKYISEYNIKYLLMKENRGGSFCYSLKEQLRYEAASYYVPTMHSVGVGDVYNSVFVSNIFEADVGKRMRLAALIAAKYAETLSHEKYKETAKLVLDSIDELNELIGIRLSWEDRKRINIYLAAPDFPDVNTELLDKLYSSLIYHNFSPRLPIRENGICNGDVSAQDELRIYHKDLNLLDDCNLLIAVLLFNDPGTLVELGMFKEAGKPTIVFDPFSCCDNMFVRHTPDYLCKTIADVIGSVYLCMGRT